MKGEGLCKSNQGTWPENEEWGEVGKHVKNSWGNFSMKTEANWKGTQVQPVKKKKIRGYPPTLCGKKNAANATLL